MEYNSVIRIDRSLSLPYPDWLGKAMHPELERIGPAEYDLRETDISTYPGQGGADSIAGSRVYGNLESSGGLERHLGLEDAMEIRKVELALFRELFGGGCLVFLRSVIVSRLNGDLYVPILLWDGDKEIVFNWEWLGHEFDKAALPIRFPNA